MNIVKLLDIAKQKQVDPCQFTQETSSSFSCSLFKGKLDSYKISSTTNISVKGIYNGKVGTAFSTIDDNSNIDYLIDTVIETATLNEKSDNAFLFEGSKKYKKIKTFNKELSNISKKEKIALLTKLEKAIYESDDRISNLNLTYAERGAVNKFYNTYGLKLNDTSNYYYIFVEGTAKNTDSDNVVSGYHIFIDNDFSKFNFDEFVKTFKDNIISKLNVGTIKTGKYKVLMKPDASASLIQALVSHLSVEEVVKGSSLLANKLNTQALSKKLTISEKPLLNTYSGISFDNEGVATYNKLLIKKGVPLLYLNNLEYAKKLNTEPTGNGYGEGSKVGIDFTNLFVKPGSYNFDDVLKGIKKGVYITGVSGLHAGLNAKSGDFNLQAEGFNIENGKITTALNLVVLSGNLFDMFNNILKVCNDSKDLEQINLPSILFKKLNVSCQ